MKCLPAAPEAGKVGAMADDPPQPGHPFDPLPGWPERPPSPPPEPAGGADQDGSGWAAWEGGHGAGRPPSAPPPGWTGPVPAWVEPASPFAPAPPPDGAAGQPRRRGLLGGGRTLAVVLGVVVLLAAAVITVAVVSRGGGTGGRAGGTGRAGTPGQGGTGGVSAPPAAAGNEIPLLDGRLVVVARPGWERLEASADTASVRLVPEASGRELLATLIVTALPSGGRIDGILSAAGGTPFEVNTPTGTLQATAVPGIAGRVASGIVRPHATFFFSLSVFDPYGGELDVALLQKVFVEQVVPQLRIT